MSSSTHPAAILQQTLQWVQEVVIGFQFCPFANKVILENKLKIVVHNAANERDCLEAVSETCRWLDQHPETETLLLVFPDTMQSFDAYWTMTQRAEKKMFKLGYEGIYQIASFHPGYCFAGSTEQDAANFTNRSPYPMLHFLREEEMEAALKGFPHPEQIPERNMLFCREKGYLFFRQLLIKILHSKAE